MKPIIGLCPLWDDDKKSVWMLPNYMDAVLDSGGVPLVLPLSDDDDVIKTVSHNIDGLLITGGHDVNPSLYNAERTPECGLSCDIRDSMDIKLTGLMLELHKPILGICRGIQVLNVALGGSLYQDLRSEHPSEIEHHMSAPYDRAIHSVSIDTTSRLFRIVKEETLPVNSYHHQAIRDLSPRLKAVAWSDDGLTEGVEMPDERFAIGVQWHPEYMFGTDESSCNFFRSFVSACMTEGD